MVIARAAPSPRYDCPQCLDPDLQRMSAGRFVIRSHAIGFTDSRGIHWTAEIGRESDGGSIPWIAEPLAGEPIDSDALPAFLLHDCGYQLAPANESGFWAANQSVFRAAADRMLLEASIAAGLPRWKAYLIYHAVRIAGWIPWREHARAYAAKIAVR